MLIKTLGFFDILSGILFSIFISSQNSMLIIFPIVYLMVKSLIFLRSLDILSFFDLFIAIIFLISFFINFPLSFLIFLVVILIGKGIWSLA